MYVDAVCRVYANLVLFLKLLLEGDCYLYTINISQKIIHLSYLSNNCVSALCYYAVCLLADSLAYFSAIVTAEPSV